MPRLLGVAFVYTLLDKVSRTYLPFDTAGSAVWLPSGLALATVLLGGRKYAWAVLVGVIVGTGGAGYAPVSIVSNAIGMTLSVLLAEWLLRTGRLGHVDFDLTEARDYVGVIVAGATGAVINAGIGIGSQWLRGGLPTTRVATAMMQWWAGDVIGVVLVVPVLLVWRRPPRQWFERRKALEVVLSIGAVWLAGQVLFLGWFTNLVGDAHVGYLGFAIVILGALRLGRHGALLTSSIVSVQTLLGHARGVGVYGDLHVGLVWLYLLVLSATSLWVALVIHAREKAERLQATLREIAEAAHDAEDLPALFGRLHEIIGELVPARNFFVALYDESTDVLTFPYYVDEKDAPPPRLKLGSGLTARVIRSGKSLLLDPERLREFRAGGGPIIGAAAQSWLGVPLVSQRRCIGAIGVQDYLGLVRYTANDQALLEFVAVQAANAIEHKRADAALRRSTQLLGASQSIAKLGGWELDLTTNTLYWTDETYRILDATPQSFRPEFDFSFSSFQPASRRRVVDALKAAREHATGFDLELEMVTTTGRQITVRVTCVVTLQDGRPVKLTGVFQDITDERAKNAWLHLLSDVVESSPAAILITDVHANIEYVNPAFESVTGYQAREVLGRNPRLLQSGRTPSDTYVTMWSTLEAGGTWRGVLENRRKDGSTFWESVTISVVTDGSGAVAHYVGIKENITHAREVEAQLRESQKLEALGTLAGGIAHEFNNTLTTIIGNGELMLDEEHMPAESREALIDILKAAQRARDLSQQVLVFSRRSGAPAWRAVDLGELTREALKFIGAAVPATVRIVTEYPDAPVIVQGDATQLHQVVVNLCTNAWHAMGAGGVLTVRLSAIASLGDGERATGLAAGRYACLSVIDNGPGMTAEVRRRIFEPFFTTKAIGAGTGLGLAVVHGIVSEHHGAITVESQPGLGTRFDVHLPLAEVAVADAPPAVVAPTRGAGERIVVVEDEPSIREMLERALQRMGYQVRTFGAPLDALRALTSAPASVDLVITDQSMPSLTGLELSRRLLEVRPDLPILLYSGDVTQALQSATRIGIREVLEKPISLADLGNAIKRTLG